MKVMKVMKAGDRVRVTLAGRTLDGEVILASPNGYSLLVAVDGILGGWVGKVPVLQEDGRFIDLADREVEITRLSDDD